VVIFCSILDLTLSRRSLSLRFALVKLDFMSLVDKDDPDLIYELIDEVAVGSYGSVYKVRAVRRPLRPLSLPRSFTSV
jgi:hypothetical protein